MIFDTKPFYKEGWYRQIPVLVDLFLLYPNSKFKIVVNISSLRLIIESSFLNKVYLWCLIYVYYKNERFINWIHITH